VAYVFYLLIEKPALILSRKVPFSRKNETEKGGLGQEKLTKLEV